MEQGGPGHQERPAGNGSFFLQPFLKPLEADTVDFSLNDCVSASLHHPSVQAWEVVLEGRTRTSSPLPSSPGLSALVMMPLGLCHCWAPGKLCSLSSAPGSAIWCGHQPFPSDPRHFAHPAQTEKQSPVQKTSFAK